MEQRKRVLVVDDEASNRELLEALLTSLGHDVDMASDGSAALAKLDPSHDLVLLDVMMPGMDGYEVARRIRKESSFPDVPICMVTALSGKEERLRAVEAGANDFIAKPIDKMELKVRTASLLRTKEAQDTIKDCHAKLEAQNGLLREKSEQLYRKNCELERLYSEVQKLAIMDELTQLYNRRGFLELGRREVDRARRSGTPLSAIMFDLDHFKRINDTAGHAMGDKVLEEVALRCCRELRKVDIFGRYGGEEFSVLLPETDVASARLVAERLRHSALEPISGESGAVSVTMSLGLAVLKGNATGLEELLKSADQALYRAKESGRNRVCVDEELDWDSGNPSKPCPGSRAG
jgi:diguanylate cyclase (GGDEF)-like protein